MDKTAKPRFRYNPGDSRIEYYDSERRLLWQVAVDGVVMVAEYTTNEGPLADDYYLIFVEADHGQLFVARASLYSDGLEEVLRDLGQRWNAKLELQLLTSTEWKSRVLWPSELVGTEYFEFKEIEAQRITNRLRRFVLGSVREYFPSEPVRQFLQSRMNRA